MRIVQTVVYILIPFLFVSCKEDHLPKPDAFLALQYPEPSYTNYSLTDCPYYFEKNKNATIVNKDSCSAIINYKNLDGALYLTYRKVDGNIKQLLTDAQKLTYEHVIKADNIIEEKYINGTKKVYGMFYDVAGDAASQSQFYVTDSTAHFLTGSIYFNTRPNYDSILPAAHYLKNDIRHLMETLSWKE